MGGGPARGTALLFAAVAMVALWGCGGDSSSTPSSSETTAAAPDEISDAQFVEQANEICKEGKQKSLKEVSAYLKKHRNDSQSSKQKPLANIKRAIYAALVPGIADQVEELRALEVSGADNKAKVKKFLAAMEEGVEKSEKGSGSSGSLFSESFRPSAQLAGEYGLNDCAYG